MDQTSSDTYDILPLTSDSELLEDAIGVYQRVFLGSEATSEDENFTERKVRHHTERNGFVGKVGVDRTRTVIGLCYGYSSDSEFIVERTLEENLPEETVQAWLDDYFVFEALAVDSEHRRMGVGRALHDAVLNLVDHETSVLTVDTDNEPARTFYVEQGWTTIYEPLTIDPSVPQKAVMGYRHPNR